VSTSEGRASQREIEAAIKVVELACAEGQIVAADRDLRIAQLRAAQTSAEVDLALDSLKRRSEPPTQPQGPMVSPSSDIGSGRSLPFVPLIGGLVSVVAAIAGVVFLVNQLSGVDLDPPSGGNPGATRTPESRPSPRAADVLSREGFQALVAAIKAETGTTNVFDATMYPTYAVVQLPVDRETLRQYYYYWDGVMLKANESFGRSSTPRVDLASVDVEAMLRLVRRARRLVEEPTIWYVIVNAPDEFDKAVMYAYASNKYSEGGYVSADADGDVIRKATW